MPQVFFPSFFFIRNSELVKLSSSLMKFIKVNGKAFLFKTILFESLIVKVPEVLTSSEGAEVSIVYQAAQFLFA